MWSQHTENIPNIADVTAWPTILATVFVLLGCMIPIFIVQALYKQSFGRSCVALCISGLIEFIIAVALFIGLAIALISMGVFEGNIG